jgi:hypothetical protein
MPMFSRLSGLTLTLSILALGCTDNSASSDKGSETGSDVNGDGDPTVGDGDPTTTGNDHTGDGDPDTGDGDPDTTGDGDPSTGDGDPDTGDGDPDTGDGDPTTGDGDGEPAECVEIQCAGKTYECGDCIDNDGDGLIDAGDPNCWGPCDNNEAGYKGNIPGQGHSPCTSLDCYFDQDSGAGNDDCYWNHRCDPSEPNPSGCTYNPNTNIPGTSLTCETAQQTQSDTCHEVCGPLTPNGCDCFGCCEIHYGGETHTVYLGTEDGDGNGTCTVQDAGDPTKCAPCIQVAACLKECKPEECHICIGQVEVPDGCEEAGCPAGIQSCNPVNESADCPEGMFCLTGCCYPQPG